MLDESRKRFLPSIRPSVSTTSRCKNNILRIATLSVRQWRRNRETARDIHRTHASLKWCTAIYSRRTCSGLTFETTDSEGAILTIPKGSDSGRLLNITRFKDYLAANIESWYRYANGPRGREAKNGDLRLVIGWDKAQAWGMATFSRSSQAATAIRLDFKPSEQAGRRYKWEYSGIAEGKTGLSAREIAGLRRASEPEDVTFTNQCLFIRMMNHSLPDDVWQRLKATKFGTITEKEDLKERDSSSVAGEDKIYSTPNPFGQTPLKFGTIAVKEDAEEHDSNSTAGKDEVKSNHSAPNTPGPIALNQFVDSSLTTSLVR